MSVADTMRGLLPFARSRRKPARANVAELSRIQLYWQEHLGWRLRGGGAERTRIEALISAVHARWEELCDLDELAFARRVAEPSCHPARILRTDAAADLALVLEAVHRETGLALRDNQIECALRLVMGQCVELRTGEGKTLAAGLSALVAARAGVPVHVVTVNDYLAARDRELVAPIARRLGLTCSVVRQTDADADKQAAYDCDIVYGTNKTFVFDALRDRREKRLGRDVGEARQMGQVFAIVDEADSVLIDDATVPMILSEPAAEPPAADIELFRALLDFASHARPQSERVLDPRGNWRLTDKGVAILAKAAEGWPHPSARDDGLIDLAETALAAQHSYRDGVAYVIRDGEVVMIDQSTGRLMEDRKWAYGMQQMIELKEGLCPSPENRTVGQMTQQTYFRQYLHLAGLTGTARECRGEFWAIYGLPVRPVAPHAPSRLRDLGFNLYGAEGAKFQAVAAEAMEVARDRAVLIGVNDVAESAALQSVFAHAGQEVAVLDALTEAQEADLVAAAGAKGRITIATHLAGRGTDVALAPEVREAGGLHVIIASMMASGRLERQLYGRAGRQGDPGSYTRHVSLADRGLSEGASGPLRRLGALMLRLRLVPRLALGWVQAARDGHARTLRRSTLLREQELARHLGYR
jgi:preprotein translocase subunit SecA